MESSVIKGRSGFTLIEMMVVVGLISIMAGIAIPAFSKWLPGYKLKNASRDVFSNIQLAKLEAIKRGRDCDINIYTDTNTYGIDTDGDGTDDKTVTLADYGSGIIFKSSTDDTITFTSRGMAKFLSGGSTSTVQVTNSQGTAIYTFEVSVVGNISMTKS